MDGSKVIKHLADATVADGINRVVWDLSTDAPGGLDAKQDKRPYYVFYPLHIDGPEVLPGHYTVQLKARGETLTVPVDVKLDPSVTASADDVRAQYDTLQRLAQMQERGERWVATIEDDKKQLAKRDPKL